MSMAPSKPDRSPLLGSLLRLVAQHNTDQLQRWLATSGFDDLQPAHSAAISPLWDAPDGERLTSLARAARITKQSMSALVDHLERTGYVERVPDPDDARAIRVRLTARGRSYGKAVRGFARTIEADWAKRIGADRVEQLRGALQLLHASLLAEHESTQ